MSRAPGLTGDDKRWLIDTIEAAIRENYMPAVEAMVARKVDDALGGNVKHVATETARMVARDETARLIARLVGAEIDVRLTEMGDNGG